MTLCAALLGGAAPPDAAADPPAAGDAETTVRADTAGEVTTRLGIDLAAVRAVAVDEHGADGRRRTTVGLQAGPLVFGPVLREGLLRRLREPVSFAPTSGIWREATALALDTSLDPTPRTGAGLTLLGGRFQAAVWEDADARTGAATLRCGAAPGVRRPRAARAGAELLFAVSDSAARPADATWYPEEAGFAGGALAHGAVRAGLRIPTADGPGRGGPGGSAGAALPTARLDLVGAASAGEYARPGGSASVRVGLRGRGGETAAAVGVEHPDYRATDGSRPEEFAAAAVSARRDGAWLQLELTAVARMEDPPLEMRARPPRERELAGGIRLGREEGPRLELAGGRELRREADGERRRSRDAALGAGYYVDLFRAALEVERSREDTDVEDAMRGDFSAGGAGAPAGLRVEQWVRITWPDGAPGVSGGGQGADPPRLEAAAGISLRPGRFVLSVRAETAREVELSAAGGQALEAAPEEYLSVRIEMRTRVDLPGLHAEDESGYLEVYGKPGDVDDGGHERTGHDGRVEAEAVDEKRSNHTDNR